MANKIKCTCGHSWSTADSSAKDKYVCHLCGKDNTMKDGGWLSKYDDDVPKAQSGIPILPVDVRKNVAESTNSGLSREIEKLKVAESVAKENKRKAEEARKKQLTEHAKKAAAKQAYVGPGPTAIEQVIRDEENKQRAIQEAKQNSPLAQTAGLLTPSGYNPGAGAIGAETFANMNPMGSGRVLSLGRLYENMTGRNPYGFDKENIISTSNILPALAMIGDVSMISPGMKPSAYPRTVLNEIDKFSKVGKQLSAVTKEMKDLGLDDFYTAAAQMQRVGITSNQRQGYVPLLSEFAKKYVTPFRYSGVGGGSKLSEIIQNIKAGGVRTPVAPERSDAWRLYLGMPQEHNTFSLSTTVPVNHPAYPSSVIKGMDVYHINADKQIEDILRNSIPYKVWDAKNPELFDMLKGGSSVETDPVGVMGNYNVRITNEGVQYNDVWDLQPPITPINLLPRKLQLLFEDSPLFYKKTDWGGIEPRSFNINVSKYFGKPFMSHGNLPITREEIINGAINNLKSRIILHENTDWIKKNNPHFIKEANELINKLKSENKKEGGKIVPGKWLDKYEEGGEYLGTTNKGFNYNGAWGGPSMEDGGIAKAQFGNLLPMNPSLMNFGIDAASKIINLLSPSSNKTTGWWNKTNKTNTKSKSKSTTPSEILEIKDPRKIRKTTGKPINPNVDLVSGKYDTFLIQEALEDAKKYGLSKEDAWNLAAIGFQESGWGKTDHNLGHIKRGVGAGDTENVFLNAYLNKMREADRLKITDPEMRLQVYNGLGVIKPETEQNYHKFKMKKIYGVPVPKEGLNMKKNPLYGKQIIDIRDNVLRQNPQVVNIIESIYNETPKKAMGGDISTMQHGGIYGKLNFLEPTSKKLPEGYNPSPKARGSSTEYAISIGGEDGEPAYLIPSFKHGELLLDPKAEFRRTGDYLGGPFKTYQEADEWERTVRHPYVEKGQTIPTPIKRWGDMAMGGSIPGSVGFTYARTGSIPDNGPYAKKTKASAQDGESLFAGKFSKFKKSLPPNLALTPNSHYDLRYGWRHSGKPKDFNEAISMEEPMFSLEDDGTYHGMSVQGNTGRFLKPKNHPSLKMELDWYYGDSPEATEFRKTHDLDKRGRYYKYVPKSQNSTSDVESKVKKSQSFLEKMANSPLFSERYATMTKASAQDGEVILKHSPSNEGYYELTKTVTPFTSKRDIKNKTQTPTSPKDVNFISNYRGALGKIDEYPTTVPYEGEKHWNIDRFIIDPAFSEHYPALKSDQSIKGLKMNVLSDMYKYNILQGQDRKEAFKNAKNFMRTEINPRLNSSFFKNAIKGETPYGIAIDKFADSNPIYTVRDINKDLSSPYLKEYAKDPWSKNKTKKITLSYLKEFKKMSGKEARQKVKDWEKKADEIDRQYEIDKLSKSAPTDIGKMEEYVNGGEMKFYQQGLDWKPRNISRDGSAIPQAQAGFRGLAPITPNDVLNFFDMLSVPQKAATKLVTGKYQTPSEAMNVTNPIGAFAIDAVLDPVNLLSGAGSVGKASKATRAAGKAIAKKTVKNATKKGVVYSSELHSHPKFIETLDEGYKQAKRNIDKFSKVKEDLANNELWKFSPEELQKYKIQSDLDDEMRIVHGIHPETSISLQKLKPESVLFDNISKMKLEDFAGSRTSGTKWSSGKNEHFSKSDMSKFKNEKEFLKDVRRKEYQEFLKEYPKNYKFSMTDLISLPKNKKGGKIKKDDNGYWNPDNWGKPVEIGSNNITMEGVYEPLLGISDTGDTKMMYPGENYKFKGKKVREYPIKKSGGWLDKYK